MYGVDYSSKGNGNMEHILIASNNAGKVARYQNIIANCGIQKKLVTPSDIGIAAQDTIENGATIEENALLKARAYRNDTELPILANDTGFWVEGEGFVVAPKRAALGEMPEATLSETELYEKMVHFWKAIADRHGGSVDAAWIESFVLLERDGTVRVAGSRREVLLTNTVFGDAALSLPVRALYISKATNKPAVHHTKEEELLEMEPIRDALMVLL